jgi:riboflavin kinase / FMN adenylyltransferase
MEASEFVAGLLGAQIGAAGVVTGEDFTFGKARGGNIGVLRDVGATCGIATRQVGPVRVDGQVVSSSRIRDALKAGECELAARC